MQGPANAVLGATIEWKIQLIFNFAAGSAAECD
jgi:hypothetical protein